MLSSSFRLHGLSLSPVLLLLGVFLKVQLKTSAFPTVQLTPEVTLRNGVLMPTLALNTAGFGAAASVARVVRLALEAGFSHIDFHPGPERDGVALVLADRGVDRVSLFLTTKLETPKDAAHNATAAAAAAAVQARTDRKQLGVTHVDLLMLRDSGAGGLSTCAVIQAQWQVLEAALAAGHARALGTVNFCESSLRCLLQTARDPPSVNYIMLHVGMGPDPARLVSFGAQHGVLSFAYGPLGEPAPNAALVSLSAPIGALARAHSVRPEEVALRWVVQSGWPVSVRPSSDFAWGRSSASSNDTTLRAALDSRVSAVRSARWALSRGEMAQLDGMTAPPGRPTAFSLCT